MKKLLNEPIEIKSYNDLKEIVGFHPCQKISFICENCGEKTIKSLSAVRKRKLLCQKCQRTLNGIKKYGSEENFKQHLKDVKKKIDETLEKKFGSTEEIKKHKVESYKKTCIEKCGVDNTSKVDFIKNNFKTNNPIFNPESKEKARFLLAFFTSHPLSEVLEKQVTRLKSLEKKSKIYNSDFSDKELNKAFSNCSNVSVAFIYSKDKKNYYCPTLYETNHQVVIIGWDDNYSKDNFKEQPPKNGAFLIKGSWGTEINKGFVWISYYDKSIDNAVCYNFTKIDKIPYNHIISYVKSTCLGS